MEDPRHFGLGFVSYMSYDLEVPKDRDRTLVKDVFDQKPERLTETAGLGDGPSLLSLITHEGDPMFEGMSWTPDVYQLMVTGPKMAAFDENREVRGRICHPRGVLPRSLFVAQQEEPSAEIFYRELFFKLQHVTDDEDGCVCLVKSTPDCIWPEDWERCRPKTIEVKKPEIQDTNKRVLKLRLCFGDFEISQNYLKTSDIGLPPLRSHARGLGFTVRDLHRLDGLIRVPGGADIIVWRGLPQINPAQSTDITMRANTSMEADCTDIVIKTILDHILASGDESMEGDNGRCKESITGETGAEEPKQTPSATQQEDQPKKPRRKGIKRRIRSFLRSIGACVTPKRVD